MKLLISLSRLGTLTMERTLERLGHGFKDAATQGQLRKSLPLPVTGRLGEAGRWLSGRTVCGPGFRPQHRGGPAIEASHQVPVSLTSRPGFISLCLVPPGV